MDNVIMRTVARVLIAGLAVWGPGTPVALAQVEITPEIREACQQFEPALRDIALTEVVPKLEEAAQPDASEAAKAEATIVETAAVAIREATETAKKALENPEQVAKTAIETLAKSGVPPEVATRVEQQMRDALAKASETLKGGGGLEEAAKYFESCKTAMAECSNYLGGKEIREVLAAAGPAGLDRGEFRSLEFVGTVVDPGTRDVIEGCIKAHFEATFREAGSSPEMMKDMMEKMMATGLNPREMQLGGPGEFHGPSPEAIAAMSPGEKQMFEAWKSGDMDKLMEAHMTDAMKAGIEHGMSPESIAHEMATMEAMYREVGTHTPTSDAPRTESSGFSETQFENFQFSEGHRACRSDEILSGEAAEHAAHGHAGCSDP